MRKREYRIPDKLPQLKKIPQVGDLVAIQDLDGTIFPCIVLQINKKLTKKGKPSKLVSNISVLCDNRVCAVMLHQLKMLY